ncbi:MAG: replication and repair protein RecF [Solirubrobacterales bacterium]|jgi:DNA replication and repair protein RecF|nr:replication and repair protein RecF [Solirubrobacterales bacterium]
MAVSARAIQWVEPTGFRNLEPARTALGAGITLVHGPNGAGKSSLLEALFVALTGRSPRTRRDREVIAFDSDFARVEVELLCDSDQRSFLWSATRSGERRHLLDGAPLGPSAAEARPPIAVFLPDRLTLVKGPPGARRAHIDRLVAALWPARGEARGRYQAALVQRNALLARARGAAALPSLDAWDQELATCAAELVAARAAAVAELAPAFEVAATELGLQPPAAVAYRPRCAGASAEAIAEELAERRSSDLARGFTSHGPHLDEVEVTVAGRAVRRYGSQGEQRTALLALLFAERAALLAARATAPLMLLDDVMSELDPERRELLAARLADGEGQALITATEASQLPAGAERTEIRLRGGAGIGIVERGQAA